MLPNGLPNCEMSVTDTSVVTCTTDAGQAKAQVGFGVLKGVADTRGTPLSTLHQAAAVTSFFENVLVTGASSGTLRATILLTGQVSLGTGVVDTAGFIKSDRGGAQLIEATGNTDLTVLSNAQARWHLDENTVGAFSESMTVE